MAPYKYKKKVTELKEKLVDENVIEKEVEKEKQLINFRQVYVFDISQTEGEAVPKWQIEVKDTNSKILQPLVRYAKKEGIRVEHKRLKEGLNGYSEGGIITLNDRMGRKKRSSIGT